MMAGDHGDGYCLCCIIFLILQILAGFICSGIAVGFPTSGTHIIKASNCDASYFLHHNISWRMNTEWKMVPQYGGCLMSSVECHKAYSYEIQCTNKYTNCMPFHGSLSRWAELDQETHAAGYKSNFKEGATHWKSSADLAMAATVFMYLFVACFQSDRSSNSNIATIVGCLVVCGSPFLMLSFILWIASLANVTDTSQLDPDAWKASFFKTCDVTIQTAEGFGLGVYTIVSTGIFVLFLTCFFIVFMRVRARRNPPVPTIAEAVEEQPEIALATLMTEQQQPGKGDMPTAIPLQRQSSLRAFRDEVGLISLRAIGMSRNNSINDGAEQPIPQRSSSAVIVESPLHIN